VSAVTDRIAAVIAEHREQGWNVTLASPMCSCGDASAHSAHLAEAIAADLQLTQEWAVQDDCGFVFGTWHKSRASAEKHVATIVHNFNFWVGHKDVSGACLVEPHNIAVSRWATPWVAP
jgi:hypothetical protein